MSDPIVDSLTAALAEAMAAAAGAFGYTGELPEPALERPRDESHGDWSCTVALRLAKPFGKPPRAIAEAMVAALPAIDGVQETSIAGPGFINFRLDSTAQVGVLAAILAEGPTFGNSAAVDAQSVHIEFCSANPTGPLHVGHGRGAAYGMALANILEAAGHRVHREYYVNDAGRQIDILATSAWLRALSAAGVGVAFPTKAYQGDYIRELADAFDGLGAHVPAAFPERDESLGEAADEALLDAFIVCCRDTLGPETHRALMDHVVEAIRSGIERDLGAFGVRYEQWFSERSLFDDGKVQALVARLEAAGLIVERGGAKWFLSTQFGDEKDRVVVRDNGIPTYFASDIAYHHDKFERGFDHIIDVWGADHHGYIPRVLGALKALGHDTERFEVLLVQFATLMRGGEKVQMSTRSGQFVELAELVHEVGADAARYYYVTRRSEQHLEFDLELAKSESKDNPVYYIQYAHARICSVRRSLEEQGVFVDTGAADLSLLDSEREVALGRELARLPEVIAHAAQRREPHQLANYLKDLAYQFHSYYNDTRVLVDDAALRGARVALLVACQLVFARGLELLGVTAPERM